MWTKRYLSACRVYTGSIQPKNIRTSTFDEGNVPRGRHPVEGGVVRNGAVLVWNECPSNVVLSGIVHVSESITMTRPRLNLPSSNKHTVCPDTFRKTKLPA